MIVSKSIQLHKITQELERYYQNIEVPEIYYLETKITRQRKVLRYIYE